MAIGMRRHIDGINRDFPVSNFESLCLELRLKIPQASSCIGTLYSPLEGLQYGRSRVSLQPVQGAALRPFEGVSTGR